MVLKVFLLGLLIVLPVMIIQRGLCWGWAVVLMWIPF